MTEDSCPKVSEGSMGTAASAARQRKKRKWDQPAESLISAGLAVPGVLPLGNMGTLVGITLPGVASLSSALSTNPVPASCAIMPQAFHAPSIQQNAVAVLQKLNQPKIQDELIAREIVINDAEPTVRYKLTKRQTQEEIQRSTGAVVITRGKYRPPNAMPDSEKPLYLHISAGAHLKETAERIKAVDRAAVMVEEMLKQGLNWNPDSTTFHSAINTGAQVPQPLNTCVFLGFETDPSSNIAARIHGPNDQYINHIMNETGATVLLRGRGSGNFENPNGEESQQALHLYLSSHNPKSLEDAKLLAENLLDTISLECGASRVSSSKVYNAVPPPQQLLAGFQSAGKEQRVNAGPVVGLTSSTVGYGPAPPMSSATLPGVSGVFPQPNMISYPQNSVSGGTSYSGYGGIYPQATPLQQVALALRQSPSLVTSAVAPVTSAGNTLPKANSSSTTGTEKHPPQKRKFQELPGALKGPAKPHQNSLQGSEFLKPGPPSEDSNLRNTSTMPPPKKLVHQSSNGMSPPPPRAMPPPPPKFDSPATLSKIKDKNSLPIKSTSDTVPDTLIKLMEYGDGDDDDDDDGPEGTGEEELCENNSNPMTARKPFWAV